MVFTTASTPHSYKSHPSRPPFHHGKKRFHQFQPNLQTPRYKMKIPSIPVTAGTYLPTSSCFSQTPKSSPPNLWNKRKKRKQFKYSKLPASASKLTPPPLISSPHSYFHHQKEKRPRNCHSLSLRLSLPNICVYAFLSYRTDELRWGSGNGNGVR